jgi:hypothetical protein
LFEEKRRPNGAFFFLLNLAAVEVSMKLDNVKSQHYFSIGECKKEKEVIKYGMGTHEYPPF